MAFVDELRLYIKAGDGGNGVVRWLQEKFKDKGGPVGGDGGRGGDVYIEAVRDIGLLAKYAHIKEFIAENGESGKDRSKHGKDGEDLIIPLPIGSVVTNLRTNKKAELLHEGEKVLILKGGRGGYGNEHFKSSSNQQPREWTPGRDGEEAEFYIELELVVDAGFIGFPNAGKSTLLNALTNAKAKIGAYQFTTLDPNLGDLYGFILADIPGLIEGASEGRGLGHKFLRHVIRTKMLLHCISLEEEDLKKSYLTIRSELETFDKSLMDKPEIIILTKTDLVSKEKVNEALSLFKDKKVIAVTFLDDDSVKSLSDALVSELKTLES